MSFGRVMLALVALVVTTSCAKPAQLGGLGVFNPQGFAGRMALAGEYAENHGLQTASHPDKPTPSK